MKKQQAETASHGPRERQYLYAVVPGNQEGPYDFVGIDGLPVVCLAVGRLGAVISAMPLPRVRPERRHLQAHQLVLRRLMEIGSVVPAAFGTIAPSVGALEKALTLGQKSLHEQVVRLDGRAEMSLRIAWDVPDIFAYFVQTHAELKALRDSVFGDGEPSREAMIEVGRAFQAVLDQERTACQQRVEGIMKRYGFGVILSPVRTEPEIANVDCLVRLDQVDTFEEATMEAAKGYDDNVSFRISGPWAPSHFVNVELHF
jgi:hypothetical protein